MRLFDRSSKLVDDVVALDPTLGTALGVPGHDDAWHDPSPDGRAAIHEVLTEYQAVFEAATETAEGIEYVAARVLASSLADHAAGYEHGDHFLDLAHMASGFQRFRSIFDVMDKRTEAGWESICRRLETIARPLEGYRALLVEGMSRNLTVAARQVRSVIVQAEALAGPESAYDLLLDEAAANHPAAAERLAAAIAHAKATVAAFAGFLEQDYLPEAVAEDGVGIERYTRAAGRMVGLDIDAREAYDWGWQEFRRLVAALDAVARQIEAGGDFGSVTELLENDPGRAAHSPEEFVRFISDRQETALADLDGTHFTVPPEVRTVTVNIAPPGGALGAYYLRPSEDFSRPGGIWYSVGDQTRFPLYHHVSTAYHEGFPGHHLQIGTAMAARDRISRAQRVMVWYPGYGEGWAMYTELLMHELGYFEKPDYVFGMLAKHLYRAVRVVADIGLHTGFSIPSTAPLAPGEPWTPEVARSYLVRFGTRTPQQAESEVLRYLGWPGQAISYKLGERELLSIRRAATELLGDRFDLRSFHAAVLDHGPMRLDVLRDVVLQSLTDR